MWTSDRFPSQVWPGWTAALCLGVGLVAGCAPAVRERRSFAIDLTAEAAAEETYANSDLAHLQYVLTWEQGDEYLALSEADRAEFMRVIWAELDPTPTTPVNERKDEHYRRLAYARREFARKEAPGWDKRGELLLRYGSPQRRERVSADVVEGLGLIPPAEIWIYEWLGQAYRLEDARLQNDYQDAFDRQGSSRIDLAGNIENLAAMSDQPRGFTVQRREAPDPEEQLAAQQMERMITRGQIALQEKPQAYWHDYGGKKLEYVFDVLNFSSPAAGSTRLEVNSALRASEVAFHADESAWRSVLEVEAVLQTPDYRDVAKSRHMARSRRDQLATDESDYILDRLTLAAEPGSYRLALSIRDSCSGNIGFYRTDVEVRGFPPELLSLSDIQLALDIDRGLPGHPFTKGELEVIPYPLGTYPAGEDVHLYFEVYGLTLSPTGDALYTVEFTVSPRDVGFSSWFGSSKGRLVPGVGTAYDGHALESVAREFIVLESATFQTGVYDVAIRVTDRVSGQSVDGAVAFGIDRG